MRKVKKLDAVVTIICFSIFYFSFDYQKKDTNSKAKGSQLVQRADFPNFHFGDDIGSWYRSSQDEGILDYGNGRPSSGYSQTVFNLKTGVIIKSWDLMGIGHGIQTVQPLHDGRYPWLVISMAQKFLECRDEVIADVHDPHSVFSRHSYENCLMLEKVASFLLDIRYDYPFIEHDASDRELITTSEEDVNIVWILTRVLNGSYAEVVYNSVQKSDREDSSKYGWDQTYTYPFESLLSDTRPTYDEEIVKKNLVDLRVVKMERISRNSFEARIKVSKKDKYFHYLIRAADNKGHITTLGDPWRLTFNLKLQYFWLK